MAKFSNGIRKTLVSAPAVLVAFMCHSAYAAADGALSFAAPQGITIIKERAPGRGGDATFRFGDEHGMKVYALQDINAACVDDCMKGFSPLLSAQGVTPFGEWSIVRTATGAGQWTYKGQPLFTHAGDSPFDDKSEAADDAKVSARFDEFIASVKEGLKEKSPTQRGGGRGESLQDDNTPTFDSKKWKTVSYEPVPLRTPPEISVAVISNAFGEGLVDRRNMTIYAYRGKKPSGKAAGSCEGPCPELWTPVRAPTRASRLGDFTVVAAADGTSQWAYRGMPLYTSANDIVPGHANGANDGDKWQVALTTRYFVPNGVKVEATPIAEVLTTNGQALYTRNTFIYQLGGHNIRDGLPGGYAVGKKLGTAGCDQECLKEWKPFVAPADARPQGYWQVLTRPDGTRQWEYKGYALYTYTGDTKPDDVNGNDLYDLVDGGSRGRYSPVEAGGSTGAALFWHVATP